MELLLGADPEMFMANEQGLIRSAHGIIPGTKEEPHVVAQGAVQVDGLALEININPSSNRGDFLRNIMTVQTELGLLLPANHSTVIKGHHYFHEEYMKVQPAESLVLGCDPDFNAWTMKNQIQHLMQKLPCELLLVIFILDGQRTKYWMIGSSNYAVVLLSS